MSAALELERKRFRGDDEDVNSGSRGGAGLIVECATFLLRAYRSVLSPILPPVCRFHPTCSLYAEQAIRRHGFLRGFGLTLVRLSKCHPFHPGGFDPVK